jgi:hypothetical protein
MPLGTPDTEKATLPAKPFRSLTATVLLALEPPASKVRLLDGKLKLNPGVVFAAADAASERPRQAARRILLQDDRRAKVIPLI